MTIQEINTSLVDAATSENIFLQTAQEIQARFAGEGLSLQVIQMTRDAVWVYHAASRRSFSWREVITPYRVVVSEVMLQQTQTYRVEPKFNLFVEQFADFKALAEAPFDEVLRYWKGLGYNRRAQNLQKIAQIIHVEYYDIVPCDAEALQTFPGIGPATAASILTFTYDLPLVFLETNIRTLFIYLFFDASRSIHDKELMPIAAKLVDQSRPREWYYALMDIGVLLKKRVGNLARLSNAYTKQSRFVGSRRQIRGKILEHLLVAGALTVGELEELVSDSTNRTRSVIEELLAENFLETAHGVLSLKKSLIR